MRRSLAGFALTLVFAAVSATGCGTEKHVAANLAVTLGPGSVITPATLAITVGDSVTWTNQDTLAHGLFSDDSITFGTAHDMAKSGGTFGFRFTFPGTYGYRWTTTAKPSYPAATGTVVVSALPAKSPTLVGP